MRLLERECTPLNEPTDDDVRETMAKLRQLYSTAYSWDAPILQAEARGAGYQNRMRYKVRASINEWDLQRLYPGYHPETEGEEFRYTYEENVDLERESKDDADDAEQSAAPPRLSGAVLPTPLDDLGAGNTQAAVVAWLRFVREEGGTGIRGALFQTSDHGEPMSFCFTRADLHESRVRRSADNPSVVSSVAKSLVRTATTSPAIILSLVDEIPADVLAKDIGVRTPFCLIKVGSSLTDTDSWMEGVSSSSGYLNSPLKDPSRANFSAG